MHVVYMLHLSDFEIIFMDLIDSNIIFLTYLKIKNKFFLYLTNLDFFIELRINMQKESLINFNLRK